MAEKRMLILDADMVRRIDENRGDMSCSEFIGFLIDSQFKEETTSNNNYVNRDEFNQFAVGMKELLRNFLEFFLSYGLELGKEPQDKTFKELSRKLQDLGDSAPRERAPKEPEF